MRIFYSDHYTLPLPDGHRFPMGKYRMIRDGLLAQGILAPDSISAAPLAQIEEIRLAHTETYVRSVLEGTLTEAEIRRIGFPWSRALIDRSLATVGGAIAAARQALHSGVSGNLAGGTHHALPDAGEGYCVFNDLAVVALLMLKEKLATRIAIIDLDVHQGNGNSAILGGRKDVFIFSMHGEKNYPFRKVPSTLDIALPDHTGDDEFLEHLNFGLKEVIGFKPDFVLYQAGVDPLKSDVLGRLSLTHNGLMERDRLVLSRCRKHCIPVSLALGGGYSNPISETVDAHINTYRVVKELF